jgi:hypothetical protein
MNVPLPEHFDELAETSSHKLMFKLQGVLRLTELIAARDLQQGLCRDMTCFVEDPQLHGWKLQSAREASASGRRLWVNNAWENPRWTPGVTHLPDVDVWVAEAGRMARAWEKAAE